MHIIPYCTVYTEQGDQSPHTIAFVDYDLDVPLRKFAWANQAELAQYNMAELPNESQLAYELHGHPVEYYHLLPRRLAVAPQNISEI